MTQKSLASVHRHNGKGRTHTTPTLIADRRSVDATVRKANRLFRQLFDSDYGVAVLELFHIATEGFVQHLHGKLACHFTSRRSPHTISYSQQGEVATRNRELPDAVIVLIERSDTPNI